MVKVGEAKKRKQGEFIHVSIRNMYKLAVIYPPTSIFNCKNFSGVIPRTPVKRGWEGRGGEGRGGERERVKGGEGCVIAFGGWTPKQLHSKKS
jgi:hypothetical protein